MSDTPKILYQYPEYAGKSFRPSNGTEGCIFHEYFCEQCIHEKFCHTQKDGDLQCQIMDNAILFDEGDEEYPSVWVHDNEGWPVCTEWVKWDWGSEDDDEGFNEPPLRPQPTDPNQLNIFPLYPDETVFEEFKPSEEPISV